MANRFFNQFRKSLEKEIIDLFAKVTFGAAGAPTLVSDDSYGVKSITRTGAGAYDIVFGSGSNMDVYNKLKAVHTTYVGAFSASPFFRVVSESVATPTTGKVTVQFADAAGVATDPANGEQVRFHFLLKNSSAK